MKIEVGKEYDVEYGGKSSFRIQAEEVDGEFVLGTIKQGTARIWAMPDRGPGDGIWLSTRNRSIKLKLVEQVDG